MDRSRGIPRASQVIVPTFSFARTNLNSKTKNSPQSYRHHASLRFLCSDAPCCEQSRTASTDSGGDCVLKQHVVDTLAVSTSFVNEGDVSWQPTTGFTVDFHGVATPENRARYPSVCTSEKVQQFSDERTARRGDSVKGRFV